MCHLYISSSESEFTSFLHYPIQELNSQPPRNQIHYIEHRNPLGHIYFEKSHDVILEA